MSEISIQAKRRTLSTKSAITQMRKNGDVPGIFYSKDNEPIPLSLPELSLKPLVYTSEAHIVNLKIDQTEEKKSILKNVQFDPVTDRIIHFDLLGISLDQEIEIEVPIILEGQSRGVREGGVIQQATHKVTVLCLPTNIPDHIAIDISDLGMGDSVHIRDLKIENVKFLQNEDAQLVSITVPRAAQETVATEETGEERTEPEVISKGKVTEEEE